MSQHTPGPWEAEQVTRTNRFGIWRVGVKLATTKRRPDERVGEEEANARLIAKAPEMYENLASDLENMNTIIDVLNWTNEHDLQIAKAICMGIQQRNSALLREIEKKA